MKNGEPLARLIPEKNKIAPEGAGGGAADTELSTDEARAWRKDWQIPQALKARDLLAMISGRHIAEKERQLKLLAPGRRRVRCAITGGTLAWRGARRGQRAGPAIPQAALHQPVMLTPRKRL